MPLYLPPLHMHTVGRMHAHAHASAHAHAHTHARAHAHANVHKYTMMSITGTHTRGKVTCTR